MVGRLAGTDELSHTIDVMTTRMEVPLGDHDERGIDSIYTPSFQDST
jgi:hypothetical protein